MSEITQARLLMSRYLTFMLKHFCVKSRKSQNACGAVKNSLRHRRLEFVQRKGSRIDTVSQEHGTFHVADEETFNKFKVGSRVRILANHSCLTAVQHSHYNVLENGEIVDRWEIIKGWDSYAERSAAPTVCGMLRPKWMVRRRSECVRRLDREAR